MALLGTHLNADQVNELSELYNKAIIALDPDAIRTAMDLKNKYNALFPFGIDVCYLKEDPKDYNSDWDLLEDLIKIGNE